MLSIAPTVETRQRIPFSRSTPTQTRSTRWPWYCRSYLVLGKNSGRAALVPQPLCLLCLNVCIHIGCPKALRRYGVVCIRIIQSLSSELRCAGCKNPSLFLRLVSKGCGRGLKRGRIFYPFSQCILMGWFLLWFSMIVRMNMCPCVRPDLPWG